MKPFAKSTLALLVIFASISLFGFEAAAQYKAERIEGDLILGNNANGQKFIFHARTNARGDFLQITYDEPRGDWNWDDGLRLLRRGGYVGIGVEEPTEKLTVAGRVLADELIAVGIEDWPGEVSYSQYDRPSLTELARHIGRYRRLPGVPSQDDVEDDGLAVGEMSALLLEKVTDLTLYVIDLNEELRALQSENDELRRRIAVLEGNN